MTGDWGAVGAAGGVGDSGANGTIGDSGANGGGVRMTGDGGAGDDGRRAVTWSGNGPALRFGGAARGLSKPRLPPTPPPAEPRMVPSGSMSASSTIMRCK